MTAIRKTPANVLPTCIEAERNSGDHRIQAYEYIAENVLLTVTGSRLLKMKSDTVTFAPSAMPMGMMNMLATADAV